MAGIGIVVAPVNRSVRRISLPRNLLPPGNGFLQDAPFMNGPLFLLPDYGCNITAEYLSLSVLKDAAGLYLKNSNGKRWERSVNGSATEILGCPAGIPTHDKVSARRDQWLAGRIRWRDVAREKTRSTPPAAAPGTIPQHGMDKPPFHCTRKLRLGSACRIAAHWRFGR